MYVDVWQAPLGVIAEADAKNFFDNPLRETHAFLFETSRLVLSRHRGALSLKLVLRGREQYWVGGRAVCVRPGDLLLINAGQVYHSEITAPTQSLSLFYRDEDLVAVDSFHRHPAEDWIDRQAADRARDVPQVRLRYSPATRGALRGLLDAIEASELTVAEQAALALLSTALTDAGELVPQYALADVRRRSTRAELISRAGRAREFIEDNRGVGCSLDRLAEIACLSKYHLLRVFKSAFGITPAAYARALRLEAARRALARGEPPEWVARRNGYAGAEVLRRALRRGSSAPN